MIKVFSVVDKIAEKCFSAEEKGILEYVSGTINMTVSAQLRYYYRNSCWEGTEEELYEAICQRKEERKDLLMKLKSLNERLALATDPSSYDEVYVRIEGSKHSSSSINTGADGATSTARSVEDSTTNDKSDSWSMSGSRDAAGEMDEVNKISDVWSSNSMVHAASGQNPSISESNQASVDIKYRQFATNNNMGEDTAVSNSVEHASRDDNSSSSSTTLGLNVGKSYSDRNVGGRKFKTGEQLVDMWIKEIPNLRNRFWRIFEGLFIHERYY